MKNHLLPFVCCLFSVVCFAQSTTISQLPALSVDSVSVQDIVLGVHIKNDSTYKITLGAIDSLFNTLNGTPVFNGLTTDTPVTISNIFTGQKAYPQAIILVVDSHGLVRKGITLDSLPTLPGNDTFTGNVVFDAGLTMNGVVTLNGLTPHLSASELNIDSTGRIHIDTSCRMTCLQVMDSIRQNAWLLSGNTGNDTIDFVGNTDSVPLFFRMKDTLTGRLDWTNVYLGNNAGEYCNGASHTYNVFLGFNAGRFDATPSHGSNVGIGHNALENTNSSNLIGIGVNALQNSSGSDYDIAIGGSTLRIDSSGDNIAIGLNTLENNTSGANNIGIGIGSGLNSPTLSTNISGTALTVIGASADVIVDGLSYSAALGADVYIGQSNTTILCDTIDGPYAVGIGTSYPYAYLGSGGVGLVVIGKIVCPDSMFTNAFQLTNGTQAANYILATDANGNAYWEPPIIVDSFLIAPGSIPFGATDSTITYNQYLTYTSTGQVVFNVNPNDGNGFYGGLKIEGRGGGSSAISLQSDTTADLTKGQWILAANGYGAYNVHDFGIWNGQLAINAISIQASTSNVGIGTNNPAAPLEVQASSGPAIYVHAAGTAIKIVDGTQAAGKVLTSDASGNASWQGCATGATGSEPGSPYLGEEYYDTTLSKFKKWNGSAWAVLTSTP